MKPSLVIIPTYNEKENVVRMLDTVMGLAFPFDVLVVDDGSPDGTAALVKEAQSRHPERIHLLEREGKLGLGTAYIAGFKWALSRGYNFIFEMDCDFSHNPEDLLRLRAACDEGGAGMSVGSQPDADMNNRATAVNNVAVKKVEVDKRICAFFIIFEV